MTVELIGSLLAGNREMIENSFNRFTKKETSYNKAGIYNLIESTEYKECPKFATLLIESNERYEVVTSSLKKNITGEVFLISSISINDSLNDLMMTIKKSDEEIKCDYHEVELETMNGALYSVKVMNKYLLNMNYYNGIYRK